ncbi:MAG: hypothetical protein B6D53_01460 [Candidatus Omnitrophica bacterium 4484_49]|nr:MAG: hypothetical protein B6D53_01460 [Candidatus Omnitrophica bacterium 4484_49]
MGYFSYVAKFLILVGLIIIGLGVLLLLFEKIPFLGKLPGDIIVRKKNFSFYFPITTSIIISIILSIILNLLSRK